MDSVKEYLDKLEINNSILDRQLKEVYIQRVVYFKEDKIVYFHLTSKDIVLHDFLDMLSKELSNKLGYFRKIKIKIKFTGLDRAKNKDIVKKYWSNILYILKSMCPAIAGCKNRLSTCV
nr:PolC-type DNA polymerase III N-terminal domain-containing protein [Clostridioides mangenotii]